MRGLNPSGAQAFGRSDIRPGRDDDAPALIALVARCWADYPGCIMDLDDEVPELRAIATHYRDRGGALWVEDAVRGMCATKPLDAEAWELCKVYVHPAHHGAGLAHHLVDAAEAHARTGGARRMDLWTDTRFDRAHRFYEKRGYVRVGVPRPLHDLSNSWEHNYTRML